MPKDMEKKRKEDQMVKNRVLQAEDKQFNCRGVFVDSLGLLSFCLFLFISLLSSESKVDSQLGMFIFVLFVSFVHFPFLPFQ